MNILWLQDLPLSSLGGAQYTDEGMVIEGIRQGHWISTRQANDYSLQEIEESDLVIASNIVTFNNRQLEGLMENGTPVIYFLHDHNFCKWRAYFPMGPPCNEECLRRALWEKLYYEAKGIIYLSPLHFESHKTWFPTLDTVPHLITPPPIRLEQFVERDKDLKLERVANSVVYVGPMIRYKGIENILKYAEEHPEYNYHFVGPDFDDWEAKVVQAGHKYWGKIANTALWKIYRRYEYFIHLPSYPMPAERTAIEAAICGCKLIVNDLVGMTSYPWFHEGRDSIIKHTTESPKRFWTFIDGLLA